MKRLKKWCQIVRAICHISKLKLRRKQAHTKEIQVNGGSTADKVEFRKGPFEQEVKVADVFAQDETVDVGGATKGKGFSGVITRWGCT